MGYIKRTICNSNPERYTNGTFVDISSKGLYAGESDQHDYIALYPCMFDVRVRHYARPTQV